MRKKAFRFVLFCAGALGWDSCGGPPLTFDNGHPIEIVGVGSAVGSMRVTGHSGGGGGGDPEGGSSAGGVGVLAASGCAISYPGTETARFCSILPQTKRFAAKIGLGQHDSKIGGKRGGF